MTNHTTHGELKHLLDALGLIHRRGPGAHHTFTDSSGRTLLVFPKYRPGDVVPPHHLILTRRQLDENGFLAAMEFERFLEQKETA